MLRLLPGKCRLIIFCMAFFIFYSPAAGFAYNHKVGHWNLNTEYTGGYSVGHNITKGVVKTLIQYMDSRHDLYVVLPDDGCTWVVNSVFLGVAGADDDYFVQTTSFTVTTAGLFEGPSVLDAVTAANEAKTSAGQAKTAADSARSSADSASANASNAAGYASTAAGNTSYNGQSAGYWSYHGYSQASSASASASSANANAAAASSRVWDAGTGKSAATLARESRDYAGAASSQAATAATSATNAYNAVYNSNGNTVSAVRDAGGTVLNEARQSRTNSLQAYNEALQAKANAANAYSEAQAINNKIDVMQASVTNISNSLGADTTPPELSLKTVSGAVATSGESIQAVLEISDNASSTFTYSLDGISYGAVPASRIISLPVVGPGSNVITVWVKDVAGNTGVASITIRKL
jgi:hypothetical protein